MILANPRAFAPFATEQVMLLVGGAARTDAADAVTVQASVVAANPATTVGNAPNAEAWTVTFAETAYNGAHPLTRGTQIEEDRAAGRWPRLTVQNVRRLGGIVHLECSAKARGAMP